MPATVVSNFMRQQGFGISEGAGAVAGRHPDGTVITVEFDESGRIHRCDATLGAPGPGHPGSTLHPGS